MKVLDVNEKQEVRYCIDLWLRDEQVKSSIQRVKKRIEPSYELKNEKIAVVCFGPSLNDTWEQLYKFDKIISCSGSHKFLIDRGIIPTYHCEVDPREHKVQLIGAPHRDVEYLIASTCHPKVFDHLENYNVKLWHVFANEDEALRVLPQGEWSLTGGSSVGLRALTIARFLGYTDIHVFGMDGSEGKSGKHATEHPSQPKDHSITTYNGVEYKTTASMLECAKQTMHELNQMPDVKATFYGEGLLQSMMKDYVPQYSTSKVFKAIKKPELISEEYKNLNRLLHSSNLAYGVGGGKHAPTVLKIHKSIGGGSIGDYGSGKSYLAKELAKHDIPIWEYDPGVPGKEELLRPVDLCICTDVLEHIEPDKIHHVLQDLMRCTKKVGYFVISTRLAAKKLADGRNAHLIVRDLKWWKHKLEKYFKVGKILEGQGEIYVVVGPKVNESNKQLKPQYEKI